MDRAEGALLVAEKALSEAKRANSTLGSVATVGHIDEVSSNLIRLEKLIETLSTYMNLDKSSFTESLNDLKTHVAELDKVGLDQSNITTSRLDHISNELDKFSSRISDLEVRPTPRDGIDGKDAEIDVEELRSIYLEDIEARFENVYGEIQNKVDDLKLYISKENASIAHYQPIDFDASIEQKLLDIPRQNDIKRMIDAEFETILSQIRDEQKGQIIPSLVLEDIPNEVAEKIAKAISIVAESAPIQSGHQQYQPQQYQQQPVVVNVAQPPTPSSKPKRITMSRDKDGNMVANVTSVDEK